MKIKNKLTLIFTLIIAVILVCLNLYIYFLSASFTENNFYDQLKDRAVITATIFLEQDEESSNVIKVFQKKYMHSLPGEIIRVYNDKDEPVFIDSSDVVTFNKTLIQVIRQQKEYRFKKDNRQAIGIYYTDNQGDFVIVASALDENGINNLSQLAKVLLLGFAVSIVVVFFSGRYFTKLMFQPVTEISAQANKISDTNLHLRLSEGNRKDELAELSIVINRMLHRLENSFDLQKNFVANASHELRTPLTAIIGNIEVTLAKARTIEEHKAVLESIMEEAEKLHKVTNGLLSLAQSNIDFSNLHWEEIRLDELLFELRNELKVKRPGSEMEIKFNSLPENPSMLVITGNKNLLETALLNIMDNACKFSGNKKITSVLIPTDKTISIIIADQGIGISEADLPHVTETFYRAGNAYVYSGSGIGLALADKIITLHGGSLSISSRLNAGTEVTISFFLNKSSSS